MRISHRQLVVLQTEIRLDFTLRLAAEMRARGLPAPDDVVDAHVQQAIAFGLADEEAAGIYADCAVRLDRIGAGVEKLNRIASNPELHKDHKLIASRMLVHEIESRFTEGRRHG